MNEFVFRLGRVMESASVVVAHRATPALQQGMFLGMRIAPGDKPTEYVHIQRTPHPAQGKTPP